MLILGLMFFLFFFFFLDISGHGWGQYPGSLDNKVIVIYVSQQRCFKWNIMIRAFTIVFLCNYQTDKWGNDKMKKWFQNGKLSHKTNEFHVAFRRFQFTALHWIMVVNNIQSRVVLIWFFKIRRQSKHRWQLDQRITHYHILFFRK